MSAPTSSLSPVDSAAQRHQLARLARMDSVPWLHQEVARRMAERLQLIRQAPQQWIDWWGALGAGAEPVGAVLPKAQRFVAEPSAAWLARSQREARGPWWAVLGRAAAEQRVMLEDAVPAAQADMVWANMALHHMPDHPGVFKRWHGALREGGFLMFSTLGPDSLRELRSVYAEQGWGAPHAPFMDMHDIGDALMHSGFAEPVMDQERITLTWSSPQALLSELRGLGGHLGAKRWSALRTPRWRDRLHAALAQRADAQGRIALSFEVVYGHAFKAPPRPSKGEPATVSLDTVRSALRSRRRAT